MKTCTLIYLFVLILSFSNQTAQAQKLSKTQFDALNNYMDCSNFYVEQLSKEIKCLYDYYSDVERYRKRINNSYRLNVKALCAGKEDSYEYQKALSGSKALNQIDSKNLKELLDHVHKKYLKITDQLHELEIYNRLKDFETDNFKRHDELMIALQNSFSEYKTVHYKLTDEIFKIYRNLQPYNKNNQYQFYENQLRTYLDQENTLFGGWKLNIERNVFTGRFPIDDLINSINETDTKYFPYNTDTKLVHPVSHYYSSFWSDVQSIQSTKRNAIDTYTGKETDNDVHSNETYRTYLNHMNNAVINDFNNYIWSSGQKGYYLLKYSKLVPTFTLDKNSKKYKIEIHGEIPGRDSKIPEIIIQSKPFNKDIANALNNYIDYINEEIRISSDRPRITAAYLKSVENYKSYSKEKLEKYKPSYFQIRSDDRIALSKYYKAINDSRFLPERYAQSLNNEITLLKLICDKRRILTKSINDYIISKEYLNDNFKRIFEYGEEFKYLWERFDHQSNVVFARTEMIFNSYPNEFPSHAWQKSGDVLKSLIEEDLKLLLDAKKHYKDNVNMLLGAENINMLSRQILIDQYKNMEGLVKIGRNHGHCPYTPYEDIPQDSKEFALKYLKHKELEKDTVYNTKYTDFVRKYNELINDYNKFVWLAEGEYETARNKAYEKVFLLKAKRELDIYKIVLPEQKKKDPVTDNEDNSLFNTMEGFANNNLILLLDVSQSMNKEEKLPLLKKSFKKLLQILRAEDKVAIVIYSGDAQIAMPSTSCNEKDKISEVIDNLESGGSTNIEDGIKSAFKLAKSNFINGGNNRIILATDGEFEVNSKLTNLVTKIADNKIHLSVFHYGKNKGKKISLFELSKKGNGNYEIITKENSDKKLLKEAKAIRLNKQ